MSIKQYILIRKDLEINKKELIKNVALQSVRSLFCKDNNKVERNDLVEVYSNEFIYEWLFEGSFKKIALAVKSEEDMLKAIEKMKKEEIKFTKYVKNNHILMVGIMPTEHMKIKKIVSNFGLYK